MIVPTAYASGLAAVPPADRALAERYVLQTTLGDPEADAAIAACADAPRGRQAEWLRLGIEDGPAAIPDAPAALRDLLAAAEIVPPWFDERATLPGCRTFHAHSGMFIGAFVAAVLLEGFSTLISKSFAVTGRLVDQGTKRLKQNNRHLSEIFLPGGLHREGEGWKLSVRIRLVHARLRLLLSRSEEWEAAAWGTPLSAAHVGFATAVFSGLLLEHVRRLGVRLSDGERESFMLVWRHAGHLMGVPPALQAATEADALRLYRVGLLCEPAPGMESVLLANALINSAPIVAGVEEPAARKALARKVYRVSRALIGDRRADELRFPAMNTFGTLAALRLRNRADGWLRARVPAWDGRRRAGQFTQMIGLSFHGEGAMTYRLPERLHAEEDRTW